jgi:hypothetical protein
VRPPTTQDHLIRAANRAGDLGRSWRRVGCRSSRSRRLGRHLLVWRASRRAARLTAVGSNRVQGARLCAGGRVPQPGGGYSAQSRRLERIQARRYCPAGHRWGRVSVWNAPGKLALAIVEHSPSVFSCRPHISGPDRFQDNKINPCGDRGSQLVQGSPGRWAGRGLVVLPTSDRQPPMAAATVWLPQRAGRTLRRGKARP